jgi:hypothetical protein
MSWSGVGSPPAAAGGGSGRPGRAPVRDPHLRPGHHPPVGSAWPLLTSRPAVWLGCAWFILLSAILWHANRCLLVRLRRERDWPDHRLRKVARLLAANVLTTVPVSVVMHAPASRASPCRASTCTRSSRWSRAAGARRRLLDQDGRASPVGPVIRAASSASWSLSRGNMPMQIPSFRRRRLSTSGSASLGRMRPAPRTL